MDTSVNTISVPQAVWNNLNIESYDFICNNDSNGNLISCESFQSCNVIAAYMPTISMTFVGDPSYSSTSSVTLDITPAYYLWQNTGTGNC